MSLLFASLHLSSSMVPATMTTLIWVLPMATKVHWYLPIHLHPRVQSKLFLVLLSINNLNKNFDLLHHLFPMFQHLTVVLPEILTAAIKPIYNGSVPSFFTFLFQLKEQCSICHFWASATYYYHVDLLDHFANINFDSVLFDLSQYWTPTFHLQVYKPGTLPCTFQLLFHTKSI